MSRLCSLFSKTRGAYYKHEKLFRKRQDEATRVLRFVRRLRRRQPRVGAKKLHQMLHRAGLTIGRDRLFELLGQNNLLIRQKRSGARTTYSKHGFRYYRNLVKDRVVTSSNQVYVSDITYLRTLEGFCYLFLITDLYSRKIVGYHLADSLCVQEALKALRMALREQDPEKELIHHSDRGIQYCAYDYTNRLKDAGVQISMTEKDHVYENATAERVNGILKTEFMLGELLKSKMIAKKMVHQAIRIYNKERLHMSLCYQTPDQVHAA